MNDRYNSVQFDYGTSKYMPMMSLQESNFPLSNCSNNTNSGLSVPLSSSAFSIDSLTSNMQATSMGSYGVDYSNANSRLMDLYTSTSGNKFSQNIRQVSNIDRSTLMSRFNSLQNSQINGPKYNTSPLLSNEQRLYQNPMNMNSLHQIQVGLGSNPHSNNSNQSSSILNSPSVLHKSMDADLLTSNKDGQRNAQRNLPATLFYSPSNIKTVSQMQVDNELENPKWIVFPPVHTSATRLRQGKQHLVKSKKADCPLSMNDDLKKGYIDRISASLVSVIAKNGAKIPDTVLDYTDITPMESTFELRKSKTFNRASICYKAFNNSTEQYVLFRRFPGLMLQYANDKSFLDKFRKIKHPGLISVNHVFVTEAFDDHSTVFIMDYFPCSCTVLQTYLSDVGKLIGFTSPFNLSQQARPYSSKKPSDLNMLPEEKAWCYFIQIINIIRYVHNTLGMACKVLDPTKILIQYPDRIRLNCFGIMDYFMGEDKLLSGGPMLEDSNSLLKQQNRDLETLGQLMLCMICGTVAAVQEKELMVALDLLQRFYSNNLKTTLLKLIRSEFSSINEVAACTFAECYNHLTSLYEHIDYLELNLLKELECGRLFRLVCKLATICERNELGMDSNWSDYGPNYQLKLFRDFVFHQVDPAGAPYLDLAHIVTCLNKLDAGSPENVCLISRDGLNMFCVTFAELKKVFDDSFEQLLARRQQITSENYQSGTVN